MEYSKPIVIDLDKNNFGYGDGGCTSGSGNNFCYNTGTGAPPGTCSTGIGGEF